MYYHKAQLAETERDELALALQETALDAARRAKDFKAARPRIGKGPLRRGLPVLRRGASRVGSWGFYVATPGPCAPQACLQLMLERPHYENFFVPDIYTPTYEAYVTSMRKQGTLSDYCTLSAMAEMLAMPMHLTCVSPSGQISDRTVHASSFSLFPFCLCHCICPDSSDPIRVRTVHSRTPTDAEPFRLASWQGVHFDAIVSPTLVTRRRQNKPETASLEETRGKAHVLDDKKTIVGQHKHKKVCDESLLQPADYEPFGTRSMCSMSEGSRACKTNHVHNLRSALAKPTAVSLPGFYNVAQCQHKLLSVFRFKAPYRSVPGLTGVVAHKPRFHQDAQSLSSEAFAWSPIAR